VGRKRFNHGWLAEVFKKERNDCCQWRLGLKAVILNFELTSHVGFRKSGGGGGEVTAAIQDTVTFRLIFSGL